MTDLAIIAGAGDLPAAIVAALADKPLICALDGYTPTGLTPDITFRVERLVPFLNHLLDLGITRVCFAGAVQRPALDPSLFDPLTAQMVPRLIAAMQADPSVGMATPVLRCDRQTYDNFTEDRRNGRVGGTTAVFDRDMRALYFSKEVLPFIDPGKLPDPIPVFHHVGVYAYRPDALRGYTQSPVCQLELLEGLEQLRFLHNGTPVRCVEVDARGGLAGESLK